MDRKTKIQKVGIILCLFLLLLVQIPVSASSEGTTQEDNTQVQTLELEHQLEAQDKVQCEVKTLDNYDEVSDVVEKYQEEDCFDTITVKKGETQVKKDGKSLEFQEVFSANRQEEKAAVKSKTALKKFLKDNEDSIYQVMETDNGNYKVTAPYQAKMIVVSLDCNINKDYGAQQIYISDKLNGFIFLFKTETDTKKAYQTMQKQFGKEKCFLQDYVYMNDMLELPPEKSNRFQNCYSWGAITMGLAKMKEQAQKKSLPEVTVAVIDSGINKNHPIFKTKSGKSRISSKSINMLNSNQPKDISDVTTKIQDGHGTHVAGTIADLTPDNVKLLVVKVMNTDGLADVVRLRLGLSYAIKYADVINASFGATSNTSDDATYLDDLINQAYKKGIPICAAAGNKGNKIKGQQVKYTYPANNDQTIAVSALEPMPSQITKIGVNVTEKTPYSQYRLSPYSFYGKEVDFTAPGSYINSASADLKERFQEASGTSMAVPHIVAAITYIKAANKKLSVQGVYRKLMSCCVDLGAKGRDEKYGFGCPVLKKLPETNTVYDSWNVGNPTIPGTVSGFKSNNQPKVIQLTWNPVKNAEGYYLYRKKYTGDRQRIAVVSSKTKMFLDKKVQEGSCYRYYIKAFRKEKVKGKTVTLTGGSSTFAVQYRMGQPKLKRLKKRKRNKVVVHWKKKKTNFFGWEIQYSNQKNFKKAKNVWIHRKEASKKVLKIRKKGTCYVRVRSYEVRLGHIYFSSWSRIRKIRI